MKPLNEILTVRVSMCAPQAILTDTRMPLLIQNTMGKRCAAHCVLNGSRARPWKCKAFGTEAFFTKYYVHLLPLKIEFLALVFIARLSS